MLEMTLATTFVPGTNLKGEVAGANWSFLLPDLNLERTLCLGSPPPATLTTLLRFSQEVIIIGPDSNQVLSRKNGRGVEEPGSRGAVGDALSSDVGDVSGPPGVRGSAPLVVSGINMLQSERF